MATGEVLSLQQYNDDKKRIRLLNPDGTPVPAATAARFIIKSKAGVPEDCTVLVVEATVEADGWAEFVFDAADMTFYGELFYRVDSLPSDEIHTHLTGRLDVLPR